MMHGIIGDLKQSKAVSAEGDLVPERNSGRH